VRQNSILVLGQLFLLPVEMYITTGKREYPVCQNLCRVLFFRAYGKDTSCRMPQRKHTAKRKHSANPTLQRVPTTRHTAKAQHMTGTCSCRPVPLHPVTEILFCRVPIRGTRQSLLFAVCRVPGTWRSCCAVRRAWWMSAFVVCPERHTANSSLCCVPHPAHGKNQPLLCASLQHTANLFKMF
jgi:hypothetical protein